MIVRTIGVLLALLLLLLGGFGVGAALVPDHGLVGTLRDLLAEGFAAVGAADQLERVETILAGSLVRYVLLAVGGVLLVGSLWPGRGDTGDATPDPAKPAKTDARTARKAQKQAAALARKGKLAEAAEYCFHSGLLDQAAEYFECAELYVRAAEIRQEQERSEEAAELYIKAGLDEAAGGIYAELEDYERAAECYLKSGRQSVAAELFEKSGQHLRAGEAYGASGFHRHAAQCFLKAQQWIRAAKALELVIADESINANAPQQQKELRTIVLQAGKLYERANELEAAQQVLEKGRCFAAAGEVAQRLGNLAKAAELYLAAKDSPRAAEALLEMGESQAAARILGEYHRDRGEEDEAARYLLEAGEYVAAGDLYRRLDDMAQAAECYERGGDRVQAAEMFEQAGDAKRAAENYESAGHLDEAATCWERAGEPRRQAVLLERAGHRMRAGRIYHEGELEDEAIKVLQQVDTDDPDFGNASALLGEIFQARGQHGLAIAKLKQAIGNAELGRANVAAYYRLATVHQANAEYGDAVSIYEKILAFDYHYGDVETRLAEAREQVQASTQPPEAVSQPGQSSPMAAHVSRPGRYQILGELGRGGMGIVYKAQDSVLDRPVAFKVLPDAFKENPQALRNFLREAKSAAKLNHPNIVTVYDAGEQEGVYYIAMEYVDGTTLKEIVRRKGGISPNGVLHVLVQMCEALKYAHEQRVIHRDIKTANTMWTRDKKAKIMDFGLAKVVEEVRNHTTLVSGTPYYMSPEQTLGKNIDHRTDIYSLGVTLFELSSGTLPFREGNVPYHHVHTPPPDVREAKADVPPLLAGIIQRCLQKDPAVRYQTTGEILDEVRAHLARGNRG